MTIFPYKNTIPKISKTAFIAPSADIIGDVTIDDESGVWFGCVIRGDVSYIRIGMQTNIQDNTTIHVDRRNRPTIIGNRVTIGHQCLLHACIIEDDTFIGMGTTIMDLTVIESESMVAAGSLVTQNKTIKRGEMWAGSPAKFFRRMSEAEIKHIRTSANNYTKHVHEYLEQ